jgi:lysophospholipase L1-like esterase
MATTFTFSSVADIWPSGTSVGAYPRANQFVGFDRASAPTGSATSTGTVASDGSLAFTGLADDTRYFAGAQVSGAWKFKGFRTDPAASSGTSSGSSAVVAASAAGQVAAISVGNPGNYGNTGTTDTYREGRKRHRMTSDFSGIRLVYLLTSAQDVDPTGNVYIRAGVETATSGRLPVFFGGSRDGKGEPGARLVSDVIPLDGAAGDFIWSVTLATAGGPASAPVAGTTIPLNWTAVTANGEGGSNGTGVPTDRTLTGTVSSTQLAILAPNAVLAVGARAVVPSVAVIGDSIAMGQGDAALLTDGGFIVRALDPALKPYVRVAKGSELAQNFVAYATSRRRRQMLQWATHAVINYGTNDIFGGRTLAQAQADLIALWLTMWRANAKVWQTTISPRTTSTDGWISTANQTKNTSAQDTIRQNLNNWLRAGAPVDATRTAVAVGTSGALLAGTTGHPLAGYFEVADIIESARDSGLWKVPGVTGTADTNTSTSLTNATGITSAHVGYVIVGTGIPAGAVITAVAGSTVTISAAATATAAGVSVALAHTGDGVHPSPAMHALMAVAVDTTRLT